MLKALLFQIIIFCNNSTAVLSLRLCLHASDRIAQETISDFGSLCITANAVHVLHRCTPMYI